MQFLRGIMLDDGVVAGYSNGNTNIRELEPNEVAELGLYDYALCSCGKEVAFLNAEFSRVESHTHFDPGDPIDVLKCRFCSKMFWDKSIYKHHLEVEHHFKFFGQSKMRKERTNNT